MITLKGRPTPSSQPHYNDPTLVFSMPLESLRGRSIPTINPLETAASFRYRFISVDSFLDHDNLNIHELKDLPRHVVKARFDQSVDHPNYCAISYPWKGISLDPDEDWVREYTMHCFHIMGAEDGDPISIKVLRDVAEKARLRRVHWIWLDRICIKQKDKQDKAWQIRRMYDVYRYSLTFILPGGLRRLITIQEPSNWMSRGWTLQEGIAAELLTYVYVLFYNYPDWSMLRDLILKVRAGHTLDSEEEKRLFSCGCHSSYGNLCSVPSTPTIIHVEHLTEIETTSLQIPGPFTWAKRELRFLARGDNRLHGNQLTSVQKAEIWQASLTRVSSRPVDMVFGIMGLFGVTLDPTEFDRTDRMGATIALASEITNMHGLVPEEPDGFPLWLLTTYHLPIDPNYSMFCRDQISDPNGWNRTIQKGHDWASAFRHFTVSGEMDSEGYFTFHTRWYFPIRKATDQTCGPDCFPHIFSWLRGDSKYWDPSRCRSDAHVFCGDGIYWEPTVAAEGQSLASYCERAEAIAVCLMKLEISHQDIQVYLILKKHATGKYHRVSYFEYKRQEGRGKEFTWMPELLQQRLDDSVPSPYPKPNDFPVMKISIGGPTPYWRVKEEN
ncbi:hypothetical protein L218DRAFT_897241 [Marasmius fiardii PR-910]|nr:hypothetical protein L218DRAFT_897241 [Marasmius fiardii PR-910]